MTYCIYNFTVTHQTFQVYHRPKKKIVQKWLNSQERCGMCRNEWKINFPIFSFWVMVDFVLKIHRKFTIFWIQKWHNLKNRNGKIDFSFISEHSATVWTKNRIWPLLRGVGMGGRVCMLLSRKNPDSFLNSKYFLKN